MPQNPIRPFIPNKTAFRYTAASPGEYRCQRHANSGAGEIGQADIAPGPTYPIPKNGFCETLSGWDLGMEPPRKKRPAVLHPGKEKCPVCARSITDRQWRLLKTCDHWNCRVQYRRQQRSRQKARDARRRRQQAEFEQRISVVRSQAGKLEKIDEPERYLPGIVPASERLATRLPQARRTAFVNHLKKVIDTARSHLDKSLADNDGNPSAPAASPAEADPLPVIKAACGTCRGKCCVAGREHAFLDVETISTFIQRHPEMDNRQVGWVYVFHIEDKTMAGSCIYHGVNGCGLPREMRAAICNEYECHALKQILKWISESESHDRFMCAINKNIVVRYAFLHV